ncbi:MAG: PEP-CTERM sorting domain-containing protein [Pontiellaceae bacterium]|nr:PEP-CTERM sorting domain-containing protein [Pontiellaceae bacterium]MBN2786423.1 PEP-CTERM sorting domain-containing protein [Pontiellaceae bacterium]
MRIRKAALVLAIISAAAVAHASLWVVGDLQSEQGGGQGDWDPDNGTLLMTDLGSGIYSYTANSLLDGTQYLYKVLDDGGTPPALWGDTEVVNANTMAYGDSDGSVLITVDTTQANGSGGAVTWVKSDGAPLQVVGSFMTAAGGASDWNPSDPSFAMTAEGDGYYSIDLVIGTAGSYEFKVTDGSGWDYQVGTDGFGNNAATYLFSTSGDNEAVTLFVDTDNRTIGVIPEPATAGLIGLFGMGILVARRIFRR